MKYISTRGHQEKQSSAEAMKRGIAPDGGLYVPETIPAVSMETIKSLLTMTYQERAKCLLSLFLTDFTKAALDTCVQGAYGEGKFDSDTPAPLVFLNDGCAVLELWHGPTSAFKDVALQILPRLMTETMRLTGEDREIVILVATSGDTGKAALDGFADVPGTKIIVFYPSDGVSAVQKQQMLTQTGANVHVVAVDGNFDDTQSGVKLIFSDAGIAAKMTRAGKVFSSANSINWGRLVPQIVYYFSAYADYCKSGRLTPGEAMNVVVPTGNFGNILAAWYAKTMGLPIAKFICASNDNNILTDFIHSGTYNKNRTFYKTVSPSMDILISSNLERLLYAFADGKATETAGYMKSLMQNGVYTVNENVKKKLQEAFYGGWADQDATTDTIKRSGRRTPTSPIRTRRSALLFMILM